MKTYSLDDIARYAEGEMSAGESQAFEQALTADETLRQQLAFYHDVHNSLQQHFTKDARQAQLEETLQQMRGEYFAKQSKPARVVSINRYLRYVMGAAAVLLITLFLLKPWQSLYDQYSDVQMVNPAERGENTDSLLQQAYTDFTNKKYTEAAAKLNQVKTARPDDSYSAFYYGIAEMHAGNTAEARQALNALYEGESVYKYEAAFYMAVCFLKEDNKSSAREWLQKIPADAANHSKARELLKKL
jgi:predicted Zn-dependent protease